MFTGIVREVGRVVSVDGGEAGRRLVVDAPARRRRSASATPSRSTASASPPRRSTASASASTPSPETLRRTTLGALTSGDDVNVEPALRAGEPLGGHYVQGHVDGIGAIESVEAEGEGLRVVVEAPPEILRYCVEKGSIAVDGVSLTVAELLDDAFAVALVPHTLEATTLRDLAPGQPVNLEVDVLAKYVERLVAPRVTMTR